jgi:hypothetical protein
MVDPNFKQGLTQVEDYLPPPAQDADPDDGPPPTQESTP